MSSAPWEQQGSDVLLRVRVQPKASRNACRMTPEGQLRIALTAPPVDGAANRALIAYLAQSLGLSKNRLRLEHGMKGREKTLRVLDCRVETLETHLTIDPTEGTP